jgi:hypothetical protein
MRQVITVFLYVLAFLGLGLGTLLIAIPASIAPSLGLVAAVGIAPPTILVGTVALGLAAILSSLEQARLESVEASLSASTYGREMTRLLDLMNRREIDRES